MGKPSAAALTLTAFCRTIALVVIGQGEDRRLLAACRVRRGWRRIRRRPSDRRAAHPRAAL